MEFTSRELATGIIFLAIILLSFGLNKDRKKLWRSLTGLAKALAAWKIWTVVLAYLTFVTSVLITAHSLGFWSTALLKDTLILGLFVGLPLLFNSTNFKNGIEVVNHVAGKALGLAALLVVYVDLVLFPLWGELILQVFLLFFVVLALIGKRDPKTVSLGKFFDVLTGLIVIGLIIYVSIQLATHFNDFDWEHEAVAFSVSLWFPFSLIPFVYLFGLMASCETALAMAKFHNGRSKLPLRVQLAFLLGVRGSLRYATSFTGRWLPQIANQRSFREALRMMREYRRVVRNNSQYNRERLRRLKQNAGTTGVDENGLWRDRREFHETKEALDRMFYSQMALYRNQGGRYWSDPIMVFPPGGFRNLPEGHGVEFRVRDDGQAWAALRHTAGGYCLGVGGTGDLDAHWRYADTNTPATYPSPEFPAREDVSKGSEASPEWHADDAPLHLALAPE